MMGKKDHKIILSHPHLGELSVKGVTFPEVKLILHDRLTKPARDIEKRLEVFECQMYEHTYGTLFIDDYTKELFKAMQQGARIEVAGLGGIQTVVVGRPRSGNTLRMIYELAEYTQGLTDIAIVSHNEGSFSDLLDRIDNLIPLEVDEDMKLKLQQLRSKVKLVKHLHTACIGVGTALTSVTRAADRLSRSVEPINAIIQRVKDIMPIDYIGRDRAEQNFRKGQEKLRRKHSSKFRR